MTADKANTAHSPCFCRAIPALVVLLWTVSLAAADRRGDPHQWQEKNDRSIALYQRGKYAEAARLGQEAVTLAEAIFGAEHHYMAVSLNNLGQIRCRLKQYVEAEPLLLRALAIEEKQAHPQPLQLCQYVHHIAILYNQQRKFALAEPYYLRALEIRATLIEPGTADSVTADIAMALANIYQVLQRDAEAERFGLQALELKRRTVGENHADVARLLNNLAGICYRRGDHARAETYLKQALRINRDAAGTGGDKTVAADEAVAVNLNNLAALYFARGMPHMAESLFRQALEKDETRWGGDHPNTARSLANLGALLSSQRKFAEAEQILRRALASDERNQPPDPQRITADLTELGRLFYSQQDYTVAESFFQRALQLRRETAAGAPAVAASLCDLGSVYFQLAREKHGGDADESARRAENCFADCLRLIETDPSANPGAATQSLNYLMTFYEEQGRVAEAEAVYLRLLRSYEQTFGAQHPDLVVFLLGMADFYHKTDQPHQAEAVFLRALRIQETVPGPGRRGVGEIKERMARFFLQRGQRRRAEALYSEALQVTAEACGERHPQVAFLLENLVDICLEEKRFDQAETFYRRALPIYEAMLGDHPDLFYMYERLSGILKKTGKGKEARAWHKKAERLRRRKVGA